MIWKSITSHLPLGFIFSMSEIFSKAENKSVVWTDGRTYRWLGRQMNGQIYECLDSWLGGHLP